MAKPKDDSPPIVDYVCGLRKLGPSRYALVTGKVVNNVPDFTVDKSGGQSQDHAAEELRAAFQKLMETIP